MKNTQEYEIWAGMIKRCENPKAGDFARYGGRGIKICQKWREDFMAFYQDLGPRPGPEYGLDRIENNGHYEPGNVRWATLKQQARNRRTNHLLTFNGQTMCAEEWAETLGMNGNTLRHRLYLGWSVEKTLTTPVNKRMARGRKNA